MSSINNVRKVYEVRLGLSQGKTPRLSLETRRLENTNFLPDTRVSIIYKKNKISVVIDENGTNKITSRRGKQVLDIKNQDIIKSIKDAKLLKVVVCDNEINFSPLKEAIEQQRAKSKIRTSKRVYKIIDIFGGGGTFAKCFDDNKLFKINAVIDYDDKKLATYEANFPNATTWCGDVAYVDWNEFKDNDIALVTPSCRPFTELNQTKNITNKEKEKAKEGDNTGFALFGLSIIRPAVIVLEEVPEYTKSYSYILFLSMLEKMGYHVNQKLLDAKDFNSLSKRKRICAVATIKEGFEFLPIESELQQAKVQDILEIDWENREWQKLEKFEKWSNSQKQKGRNFTTVTVDRTATSVSHPTTRYYNRQYSTVLENKEGLKDFFTPRELARIASIPDDFILPENRNDASFVIGDGVEYKSFSYIAKCIETYLKRS